VTIVNTTFLDANYAPAQKEPAMYLDAREKFPSPIGLFEAAVSAR